MRNLDNSFNLILDDLEAAKRGQDSDTVDRIRGSILRIEDVRIMAEGEGRKGRTAVRWAIEHYRWSMAEADEIIGDARRK